jgi:MarR family 2-MHQ and catechol resistance regulon transcriptional repressor
MSNDLTWRFLMPTHFRGDSRTVLALDTFIKLSRASDALASRLAHGEMIGGLTLSQFGVMETLFHLGPLCQGQISAKLLKSTGNVTLVLDNLEKHGLVERKRQTEDRRMVMINLTPKGESLIKEIFPHQAAKIAEEFAVLTEQEQVELGRLCKKLGIGITDLPVRSNSQQEFNI